MALHDSRNHIAVRPRRVTILPPRPQGADGGVSARRRRSPREVSRVSTGTQLHYPPLRGPSPEPVRAPKRRERKTLLPALRHVFIRDVDPDSAATMSISRILAVIAVAFA